MEPGEHGSSNLPLTRDLASKAAVLAAAVAVPLYLVPIRLLPPFAATVWANVFAVIAAVYAAVAAWSRVRRVRPRRLWVFLGAYCAAWGLGQTVWTYYEVVARREVPFPSWADAGYLGAVPFAIAAAVALPRRATRRARTLLDGMLVALSLFFVAWAYVMAPLYRAGGSAIEVWLGLAYPMADTAVVTAVIISLPRLAPSWRPAAVRVLAGLVAIAGADAAFAYLTVTDQYSTGSVIDVGWVTGFILIAAGAIAVRPGVVRDSDDADTPAGRLSLVLPYLFILPVMGTSVALQATRGELEGTLVYVGMALVLVLVARHIVTLLESEQRAAALAQQAAFDSLTGLWNRHALRRHLDRLLENRTPLGVLFIDVDSFKDINDVLGHGGGDQLLAEVARRLRGCMRAGDAVARLGGDEFAVVLAPLSHHGDAVAAAGRISGAMDAPVEIEGTRRYVTLSIGIALGDPGLDGEEVLRNADFAMYAAKRKGKNRYEIYEPEVHADAVERIELNVELQRAVERGEFCLHYQPKYDLASRRVVGAEALIRWNHPDRGLVRPNEFIAVAEASGHIDAIGRWVLDEAFQFACRMLRDGVIGDEFDLCVNVSPIQLFDESLFDVLDRALGAAPTLAPRSVVLELTESSLMDPAVVLPVLARVKERGLRIAIDDFGTGYSSLSYLNQFPVDILKIDRAFVAQVDRGVEKQAMAKAIIVLAETLRMRTVAEGIERASQARELLSLGCRTGQGYYFAEPLSEHDFKSLATSGKHLVDVG